jgi:hypothetical protein
MERKNRPNKFLMLNTFSCVRSLMLMANTLLITDAVSTTSSKTLPEAGTVATEPLTEPFQPPKLPKHRNFPLAAAVYEQDTARPYYKTHTIPVSQGVNSENFSAPFHKHGLLATRDLEAGVRIIWEAPLITLPAPGDQIIELMTAFEKLEAHEQEKIWSLNPVEATASPLLTYLAEQIAEKLAPLKRIANKPESKRTAEEQDVLSDEFPKLAKASEMFRIAARWHAARYSLINLPEGQRDQLPSDTPITGLFSETARLRHSCVPNCYAHYNPVSNLITVHTTKTIAAGEELTLSTIPAVYYHNATARADELNQKFGIICTCEACDPCHPKFKLHENARSLAYIRVVQLEHFLTLLDVITHDSVATDLCLQDFDRIEQPDLDDLRDAEATVLALIKSLKFTTNCDTHPELIRWYNALIERIQPRVADELDNDEERVRWWRIMLRHALECERAALRCFGKDSDEYRELGHRRQKIERKIDMARERDGILKKGRMEMEMEMKMRKEVGESKGQMGAALEKEKEEWEIIETVVEEQEGVMKDARKRVVGMSGKYAMTKG